MELPGNDIIEAEEEGAGLIDGWMWSVIRIDIGAIHRGIII